MKAILPAAGVGTRLRPQTHTKPKSLLHVGTKPIIGHILDELMNTDINEVILIVGFQKDRLIKYVTKNYSSKFTLHFKEQKNRKGLGHAVYCASDLLNKDPVMIVLGDSIYEQPYTSFLGQFNNQTSFDIGIAVREVNNPKQYGVVTTDGHTSKIIEMEEKPENPKSNLAITGLYIFKNSENLITALNSMIKNKEFGKGGELQLTDAIKKLLNDYNANISAIPSGNWYDCGRKKTLLEANKFILSKGSSVVEKTAEIINCSLGDPIAIAHGCKIQNSVIGGFVSIAKNSIIENSIIMNSIIGEDAIIHNTSVSNALIGDSARVYGSPMELNVGDHSVLSFDNGREE